MEFTMEFKTCIYTLVKVFVLRFRFKFNSIQFHLIRLHTSMSPTSIHLQYASRVPCLHDKGGAALKSWARIMLSRLVR